MDKLTEGAMVHYVLDAKGKIKGSSAVRAAVVTHIWDKDNGLVNLYIIPDASFELNNYTLTFVEFDESGKPGTWHWMPKV
jgi:hypothetical protein